MRFLDIHTHHKGQPEGTQSILSLSVNQEGWSGLPEGRLISLGLHPWFTVPAQLDEDIAKLEKLAGLPQVRMIGECGLDHMKGPRMGEQLDILKKQVNLAQRLEKPVILHCVRAYDELIAFKKTGKTNIPMIIHGFNKHVMLGRQLLDSGFMLSFGKALLNEQSGAAQLVQQRDDFFLETDDANISIEEVYAAVANLRKCSVEELKALIFDNWKNLKLI